MLSDRTLNNLIANNRNTFVGVYVIDFQRFYNNPQV